MSFVFTSKHKSFIKLMLENEEQEQKGFELLLAKSYCLDFFDYLYDAGLFSPDRLPGPLPGQDPSFVRIPYWAPLDYLVACAKRVGEEDNVQLANKLLFVVRSCSEARDRAGNLIHNYHTSRKFVEILAALPSSLVTHSDIALIEQWLSDPYEQGIVCKELDEQLLPKLLASDLKDDWLKATKILEFCTDVLPGKSDDDFVTVADDYWLKQLLGNHAVALGAKVGKEVSDIFVVRLEKLFGKPDRLGLAYLYRPAVEDHPQNRDWYGAENRCVDGLRDVLLSWVDSEPIAASRYLKELLTSDLVIVRRIVFHVIDQRWATCADLFIESIAPEILQVNYTHEIYQLLNAHFRDLDIQCQNAILALIKNIKVSDRTDASQRLFRTEQRRWLSAIKGKGNEVADKLFDELGAGESAVGISPHPDFHCFMESRWGDGDSPYQVEEILAFARESTLISRLNDFQQTDRWEGPTTRALVNVLETAVAKYPGFFLANLSEFLKAKPAYQYAVISGLKQAWISPECQPTSLEWIEGWSHILDFLNELLASDGFWNEEIQPDPDFVPDRNWIPPAVADLLRAGTKNDKCSYDDSLLQKSLSVIKTLLARSTPCHQLSDDPMNAAINSPRGKAIEALFSHTRRHCYLSNSYSNDHTQCWSEIEDIYDNELSNAKGGNFEFSTLAAAYLLMFERLAQPWLEANIDRIFPSSYPENFDAAIGGLSYANFTTESYQLLRDSGVIAFALTRYQGKASFENKLVERIALAYLWEEEQLDSPRFRFWFEHSDTAALQVVSHFFWSVKNQEISDTQRKLILDFWRYGVDFACYGNVPNEALLSSLGRLAVYLDVINQDDESRLLSIAPYLKIGHNADWFIEGLEKLSNASPQAVFRVLMEVLKSYRPIFDFEDRIANIAMNIASHGSRVDAVRLLDTLRHLRGMGQLIERLSTL